MSLLLHAPVTPLAALIGLLSLLKVPEPEEGPVEQLNGIPVSLLSEDELAALGGEPEPEPPQVPEPDPEPAAQVVAEPIPKPKPKPKPAPEKPEEETNEPDGGAPDAGDDKPAEEPGPEEPKPAEPVAQKEPAPNEGQAKDPLALAGAAAPVADPNANVRLLLLNDRIRNHPVGKRIGGLVARLPQWSSFFGPTSLDPVQDIDQLYVAGPQFRVSAEVIAILEYNVEEKTMRDALDAIVQREPKGEWLDAKYPAARARADRAERTFLMPRPGTLVMVPPALTERAIEAANKFRLPRLGAGAALVAFVNAPHRALRGVAVPFTVPESIQSVKLSITPAADGGVVIELSAVDAGSDEAARNAQLLTRAINLATQQKIGALGSLLFGSDTLQLIEPVTLVANGDRITGSARATARQLDRILNFAESFLDARLGRPVSPSRASSAPSPVTPRSATSTTPQQRLPPSAAAPPPR